MSNTPDQSGFTVERLDWRDEVLGTVPTPKGTLEIRSSVGSGLAIRPGDPPRTLWALGDRGPNLKVKVALNRYGLDHLAPLREQSGAKIMPRLDLGPAISELRISGTRVELVRTHRLSGEDGRPLSGLAKPGSDHVRSEPVFDLAGNPLLPDPLGLDSEGLVALADGGFWIGDEFAPALVRLDARGRVLQRLVPGDGLPPLAARRQLNRGFEALAASVDERALFLAFQSPLAHPDEAAHEAARHVRLWRIELATGVTEYVYPLDPPTSFRRDCALGEFDRKDIKVSELVRLTDDLLLVLERGSATTKIYRARLSPELALPPEQLDLATRPTLEQLSGGETPFPFAVLPKELVFSTDDAPEVAADLEGMVLLSETELLLVNDNDFGVEGAETSFWRVTFDTPLIP